MQKSNNIIDFKRTTKRKTIEKISNIVEKIDKLSECILKQKHSKQN